MSAMPKDSLHIKAPPASLYKGVVVEHIDEREITVKPLVQIARESNIIFGILIKTLRGLLHRDPVVKEDNQGILRENELLLRIGGKPSKRMFNYVNESYQFLGELHFKLGNPVPSGLSLDESTPKGQLEKIKANMLHVVYEDDPLRTKHVNRYWNMVLNGELDRLCDVKVGSFARLLEADSKLNCGIPSEIHMASSIHTKIKQEIDTAKLLGIPFKKYTSHGEQLKEINRLLSASPEFNHAYEALRIANFSNNKLQAVLTKFVPSLEGQLGKLQAKYIV
jgi:hypothetical protein